MRERPVSFDQTEQVFGLHEYLVTRCEFFLDFDPVPYPEVEDEPTEEPGCALNTAASGG